MTLRAAHTINADRIAVAPTPEPVEIKIRKLPEGGFVVSQQGSSWDSARDLFAGDDVDDVLDKVRDKLEPPTTVTSDFIASGTIRLGEVDVGKITSITVSIDLDELLADRIGRLERDFDAFVISALGIVNGWWPTPPAGRF
jgi:hypothetical protein